LIGLFVGLEVWLIYKQTEAVMASAGFREIGYYDRSRKLTEVGWLHYLRYQGNT
jgi:hypothetical protein